jgi:single-strand DNA-binding protein
MFNNAGVNKVFLVGYVGKTPSVSHQPDGQIFYCFPLATNEFIKKQNKLVEHTEWHQIKVPAHQFASNSPQIDKGHLIYLEGKITSRSFVDEQGVKRYRSDVVSIVLRVLTTSVLVDNAGSVHA